MNNRNIKSIISLFAFFGAITIGFIAMFIPPKGIIDASVLWFTAQLLVFTSSLLGIDLSIDHLKQKVSTQK